MKPNPNSTIYWVAKATLKIHKKFEIIPLHYIRSPWNKTGFQPQQKVYKLMESKQFSIQGSLIKELIKKEMKDFLEFHENKSTTYPNL